MREKYLNYLISECKKFSKKYNIFDIVLYGSFIKGKNEARDIDILIIFSNENLKNRVDIAHELKEVLRKKIHSLDIKTMNLEEFFDSNFLARQSVFVEGYSLLYKETFAERLGFKGNILFNYNLKNLNHVEKTRFTYALIGRNRAGIIKKLDIDPLGKGVVLVSIKNSLFFEEFLKKWKVNYNKKMTLVSSI